jgi:serine/threonine-protein kinase
VIQSTIDGRYQVITRIASGGMGEVYRAHDAVLGREVALKVLHPQFAGDRGFVERFRREARAAAILNHPNVVGVYDWGSTDGTYFMIMEFVRGVNLRALLSHHGRLEPAQVSDVAVQVLAALEHAHGHGIVHRDVKPENVLISEDGTVKVADFGLARAYADSYVSQAEGTVTGTVQYLAPEQIRGEPADPRTDLYALGVVMFELLTGRAPFTGETSLGIAYQHLSGRVPPPSELSPGIPTSLDRIVLRATAKERGERPVSARAMRDEVARDAASLPPAEPVREVAAEVPATEVVAPDRATTVTIPRVESPRAKWARRLRRVVAVLALLAALGGAGFAVWKYVIPHYTVVPRVQGLSLDAATRRLEQAGLSPAEGPSQFSHQVPAGVAIGTSPGPGMRIRKGGRVLLILSKGPQLIGVPDLLGRAEPDATGLLTAAGFLPNVKLAFDDTVPEGQVIDQSPDPGVRLERGSGVTITVSKGPQPVRVPDVTGQPAESARAALQDVGFVVNQKQDFSSAIARGSVISTDPPAGKKAPKGSTVTMLVSKGPRTFPMPNVTGLTRAVAVARLQSMGLAVDIVPVPGNNPPDTVVFQDPPAGTIVEQGDTVTIYVTGT